MIDFIKLNNRLTSIEMQQLKITLISTVLTTLQLERKLVFLQMVNRF